MSKRKDKPKLDVDYIGGEKLTVKEETELKNFFAQKKEQKQKKRRNLLQKRKETTT